MNKLILEIVKDRREKLKQCPKDPEVSKTTNGLLLLL